MSRLPVLAGVAALACLIGVTLAVDEPKKVPFKLATHKVQLEKLQPEIVEHGSLDAMNNTEIVCALKGRGGPIATTIKRVLVEDGDIVKKGQLLIELDASPLEEQLKAQQLTRDLAKRKWSEAGTVLALQQSQNESEVTFAKLNIQLAQQDLDKYVKGDVEQLLQDIKGRTVVAEVDVEQAKENLEQAEHKGKQIRIAKLRLEAAQLALEKIQLEREVLQKYGQPRTETDLRAKLAEAKRTLGRVEKMAQAREAAALQEVEGWKANHEQESARCDEWKAEIDKCKLYAPKDGMAVYFILAPRGGLGHAPLLAVGEPVREGQRLLFIPDLSKMQVSISIPEALAGQVRPRQAAQLRIDAYPNREFRGSVSRIDELPTIADGQRTDEKSYTTVIALEGKTDGLRPGLSVAVNLPVGKPLNNVLTVPLRALLGKPGIGKTVSCLVQTAEGPEEREVLLGQSNDKLSEVQAGLREGDEVILNPRLLLDTLRDRIQLRGGKTPTRRGE
jgi:HlyD family secretion protein